MKFPTHNPIYRICPYSADKWNIYTSMTTSFFPSTEEDGVMRLKGAEQLLSGPNGDTVFVNNHFNYEFN